MKLLFKFIKPHTKQVVLLMLLYIAQAMCALFLPYVMSDIVEIGIREQNLNYILQRGAVMVALSLGALLCALVTNSVSATFSSKLSVDMRQQIFNKVNSLSFEQFSEVGTAGLITRTTEDVSWVEEVLAQAPFVVVNAPTMFIGGIILSFRGDWVLPLIFLCISAVALTVATLITTSMDKHWKRGDEFADAQNRIIRERLTGIRVVRAFDREPYEHKRAAHATSEMNNSFVKANTISNLVSPIVSLFLNIATVAVIYVGAVRLQAVETLKAGDILATVQYVAFILNAILMLSWSISAVPHVKVSLNRISEIMQKPASRDGQSTGEQLSGDIEWENVSFSYGDAQCEALSKVNFSARQGETVAVIGGTGSGKTTLVKLLLDFYPTTAGNRKLGGKSYSELTPATVRDNISVSLQKNTVFEGSVAYNVKMGNADATDEQVMNALEICQMADFVNEKSEGMDYLLTQAGNNISGGQKQRINIARTILKPASVYIFDDSFSALDYLTEANLRRALNVRLKDKTQIIVTQRAATAMRCDKIYVLEKGKVVGVGTHEQLMKECQTYKEIYQSQMGEKNNG